MDMSRAIGHEIHVLSKRISRFIDNSPVKMQIEDATGNNIWIIAFIARHSDTDVFQRDLEKQFGITRSTASKVVTLMERKGFLERKSVLGDARLKKLVLTERSWEVLDCIDAELVAIEAGLSKGFTPEELDQFFDYMHRVQENISALSHTVRLPEE